MPSKQQGVVVVVADVCWQVEWAGAQAQAPVRHPEFATRTLPSAPGAAGQGSDPPPYDVSERAFAAHGASVSAEC